MELYRQSESKYRTADFIVNGRRYRKSTKQTTRAKAGEVAAEFLRQAQRNEIPVRKGQTPTLRQFVEKHFLPLNDANARTKLKTKEYYYNGWCRLEHQPIVDMRMDQIRTPHIETIHVAGSPSTHNCALRTLRRIFHIAVDLDVIPKVPKFSLLAENQRTQLITPEIETKIAALVGSQHPQGFAEYCPVHHPGLWSQADRNRQPENRRRGLETGRDTGEQIKEQSRRTSRSDD
jgi:hypothetical protein